MAVSKFYASWEKENGEREIINAFKGLQLREDAVIFTTPKEKGQLYDIETGLHVLPKHGKKNGTGQPYFSYYSKESSPLKYFQPTFEYTPELNVFLRAFDGIRKFKLQDIKTDTIIEVYVKHSYKLKRIKLENEFFVVKIYLELIETKPYSYCYKFNERLALEFLATSKPSPLKRVIMAKKGIALFEAKAVIPKWIKEALPEEFETEEIFEQIAKNIQHTYSRTNYRLLGKFEREAAILPEYRERYEIMDRFERQCKELEAQIREYENKLEAVKEDNEKIKKERDKQRILLEKEKKELEEYKSKNEYYRLVERENDSLHNENSKLIYENEGYLKEIQESKLQRKNAEDQVKAIKNELESQKDKQTWLSKLFMKK